MEHITKDLENLWTSGVINLSFLSGLIITFILVGPRSVSVKRSRFRNVQPPKSGNWLVQVSSKNIQYQNMNIKNESWEFFWCTQYTQIRDNIESNNILQYLSELAGLAEWSHQSATRPTTAPGPAPSLCLRSIGLQFHADVCLALLSRQNNCQYGDL